MGRRGETNKQKLVAGVLFHDRDSQNDSCETRVSQRSERVRDPDQKQTVRTSTTWDTRLKEQRGVKELFGCKDQGALACKLKTAVIVLTSASQPRQSVTSAIDLWLQSVACGCSGLITGGRQDAVFNLFCHLYNKALGKGVCTSLQCSPVSLWRRKGHTVKPLHDR